MWRSIHSIVGILAAIFLIVTALSGAILATKPINDNLSPFVQSVKDQNIASLLKKLDQEYHEIERIAQKPNGAYVLTHRIGANAFNIYIDVHTGKRLDKIRKSEFYSFFRVLHRSFFLDRNGRLLVGILAICMTILTISGIFLTIRRQGGLLASFGRIKGHWSEKWHTYIGRLALLPLMIIAVSGIYMSAVTFHLVKSGESPKYPETAEELDAVPAYQLEAFQKIKLSEMIDLTYPIPGDWFDVYTVKHKNGYIFIDQFTGKVISEQKFSIKDQIYNWIIFLHTAEGSTSWAIILLLASAMVPIFSISGIIIWYRRKVNGVRKAKNNCAAHKAEIVILVGSESGSTWGFAKKLHEGFVQSGFKCHINQMNKIRHYPNAKHLFIFTATYGDGDAPQNAKQFKRRMSHLLLKSKYKHMQNWQYNILAFGDKAFPKYCQFGSDVDQFLHDCGKVRSMELFKIDRKSLQAFEHWGEHMLIQLGLKEIWQGDFKYKPKRSKTQPLWLQQKITYGEALGTTIASLRFKNKRASIFKHQAGDLIAIIPPNDDIPRLYSVASNANQKCLEICVRKQEGGLCSNFLCELNPSDKIDAYLVKNHEFHAPKNRAPLIMIGAGTGIAPFIGMINDNHKKKVTHLFWGGRDPNSDYLYEFEIDRFLKNEKLTKFHPAFSRVDNKIYVQDRLRDEKSLILELINQGATIMICGGAAMAKSVRNEIEQILIDHHLTIEKLRKKDRFKEDIY